MKKLFIITATLNCEDKINQCIDSVKKIKNRLKIGKIHHLIADGGSTDKTLSIIKTSIDEDLTLVSTKDKGIYDAWNKCILYANSICKENHWFNFLGSDDYLLDGFLYYLNFIFKSSQKKINLYTSNSFYDGDKKSLIIGKSLNKLKLLHSMQISNSTAIYKNDLFRKKLFDISYKIVGDYDFLIRNQKIINSTHINCTVTFVRTGGLSIKYKSQVRKEAYRALLKYYRKKPIYLFFILCLYFLKFLKNFFKKYI